MTQVSDALSGKSHRDENFPVASWIVAPRHRDAIMGFYRFVRAADDVADHPSLAAREKHRLLDRLEAALTGRGDAEPEAEPLRRALLARDMAPTHALDMLVAFRQDVETARYDDWSAVMAYCAHSAMPVGRFVLDVHGEDRALWPGNDALCAALQMINHLQDCGKDFRMLDRVYLPERTLGRHGAAIADLGGEVATPALRQALVELAGRTAELLRDSAGFASGIRDWRLGLEVAAIQRLAEALTRRLLALDPLRAPVRLSKPRMLAVAARGVAGQAWRRLLAPERPA